MKPTQLRPRPLSEAYPTKTEATEVTTALLEDVIPRFGLPSSLQSDNVPVFISGLSQGVNKVLQMNHDLHSVSHPQRSGKVERANPALKKYLVIENSKPGSPFFPSLSPNPGLIQALMKSFMGRPFLNTDLFIDPETHY